MADYSEEQIRKANPWNRKYVNPNANKLFDANVQ